MHAKAQYLQTVLDSLGVSSEVRELPASTRTAQDAAAATGTTVGQIAKSLVFLAGADLVLVIASGSNRVSMDKVSAQLGAELSQPDAKTVKNRTGYSVGGVPPIGHAEAPITLLDEEMLRYQEIWAAAGTPNAIFRITPHDLVRVTEGTIVDVKD